MSAKRKFIERCRELRIDIQHEIHPRYGSHYLMIHAPEGMIFSGYEIDCIALWEGEKGNPPDWKFCLDDMEQFLPLTEDE